MNRISLGIVAIALVVIGVLAMVQYPSEGAAFAGACIRVGLVLGALWLSLPQITYVWSKTPRWLLIVAGVALVVCVVNPWYFVAAVPILAALWFLGPKVTAIWKAKPGTTSAVTPSSPAESPEPGQKHPRRRSNAR